MPPCPTRCYVDPPPTDYDCEGCTDQPTPGSDWVYRLPANVVSDDATLGGSCFDNHIFKHVGHAWNCCCTPAYNSAHAYAG